MALGVMEIATITRSQDYATIKQHETSKVVTDQSHITAQVQKDASQKTRQVREGEQPAWQGRKFDAKEKGNGQYSGDGGQKKKSKHQEDLVRRKTPGGFDVKI